MLKPPLVEQVRRRLIWNGFARGYAERTARELEDHWNDLVDEALRQGNSRPEAEAAADQRLGKASELAEEISARLRQTSWLGRHPLIGFAGFAILTTLVWWALLLFASGSATGLFGWTRALTGRPAAAFNLFLAMVDWIRSTSFIVAPCLVCFVAQRYFCGWKPALWGCLIAAIHNSMHFFQISGPPGQGTIAWGYSFSTSGPEIAPIFAPLCVFFIFTLWRFRPRNDEPSELELC